jgi:hypothetical protein
MTGVKWLIANFYETKRMGRNGFRGSVTISSLKYRFKISRAKLASPNV